MGKPTDFFSQFLQFNPFPPENPLHKEFIRMASGLATDHARIGATIHERLSKASTETDYLALRLDSVSWMFDLYARMYALATTFETLQEHTRALETLAPFYMDAGMRHSGSLDLRTLRLELNNRLIQRKFYWISKLHEVAAAREKATIAVGSNHPTSVPGLEPLVPTPEESQAPSTQPSNSVPQAIQSDAPEVASRRALVDAWILEAAFRTGKKITRTHFWKAAGYKTRTEFERWQRNDSKTTKAAAEAFERVLRDKINPK